MTFEQLASRDDVVGRYLAHHLHDRASCFARLQPCLAMILEGTKRAEAAKAGGMDRQTLRDWVHRFNVEGPKGLNHKQKPSPSCRLSEAQQQELAALIEAWPDLAEHGVVHLRSMITLTSFARPFDCSPLASVVD